MHGCLRATPMLIVTHHRERNCTRARSISRLDAEPAVVSLDIASWASREHEACVQRARFMVHHGAARASRVRVRSIWMHSGHRERSVSSSTVRARSLRADVRVGVRYQRATKRSCYLLKFKWNWNTMSVDVHVKPREQFH